MYNVYGPHYKIFDSFTKGVSFERRYLRVEHATLLNRSYIQAVYGDGVRRGIDIQTDREV